MKKICISILTILLILFALTSCGKKEVAGGYSDQRDVTASDMEIFEKALGSDADNYEPIKVAMQVVAGTNYKFYAKDLTTKNKTNKYVDVVIYVSLEKDEAPTVTEIVPHTK